MKTTQVLFCLLVLCSLSNGQLCDFQPLNHMHEIFVDPTNPNSSNSESCYTAGEQHPCADINFALAFPNRTQFTKFLLSSAVTHYLQNNVSMTLFDGASSVTFSGDKNGTAIVECMDGAGLAFLNSVQVTFHRVSFQKCGAWRGSTSRDFTSKTFKLLQIRVALYFYNCQDVTMVNMSVLNSTEAVGVVMYSTSGVNYIACSHFEGNRISESNKNESGGGGFAVEFNYCKPGDNSCNETNHQTENNQNAVYVFEYCIFKNNRGTDQSGQNNTVISVLPHNETHFFLGRGGGLSLYFKGNASNNTASISNCYFILNNATWGAGIVAEFADRCVQNVVNISYVVFTKNYCSFTESSSSGAGGGVRVSSVVYYTSKLDKKIQRNAVLFSQCTFNANKALLGGAMSLSYHVQPFSHKHQLFQVNVSNSYFDSNYAQIGSAISINNGHYFSSGELGTVIFDSCSILRNTIVYVNTTEPYSIGIGALYISEVPVTFVGHMSFHKNTGTALAVVGTPGVFSTNISVTFSDNHGSNGGAIALLGMATLVIGKNTSFTFKNNFASLQGGAIFNNYVAKEDIRSSSKCFIQYTDPFTKRENWQTYFYFKGNKAGKLGHSIFSTTILPCWWSEDIQADHNIVSDIFCWNNSIWVYDNSSCDREISTYPRSFNFSKLNADPVIYPGHKFKLSIDTFDDLDHDVSQSTIYTATTSNTSLSEVDPVYTYIADGYVSITGEEDQTITLELNTANTRDWHLQLDLIMEKCPPGFVLNNDSMLSKRTCKCLGGDDQYTFSGNLFCDENNLVSKITNGYWIGFVPAINNDTLYVGTTLLLHRSNSSDTFPIAKKYKELDADQCSHLYRKGPLCGECISGYSTAVNSYHYECVKCTSNTTNLAANIATYICLTYIPYLIVFMAIIYFDVRLMSGPLVGFILYAQLIGSGVVDLTTNNVPYPQLQKAYRVMYGVFNLNSLSEVMDPFCVHENFSALDVICLDYAVAVLPLLLILLDHMRIKIQGSIKLRQRKATRARENVNESPERSVVHAFVGFIYLSYAKFTLASIKTLSTTSVFDQNGSVVPGIQLVYYAGQFYFGQPQYILPYGLIAIIVFVIVAIILPVLLLGPFDFINWLTDRPKFQFLNNYWPSLKINTFLDAFRGCYRLKCWFFTGSYFLFRLTVFIIFAFSTNQTTNNFWQLFFLFLLTVLVTGSQPYQAKALNYLDVLIFFDLTMINMISSYLYSSNVRSGYPFGFYVIGLILIWLPMIYFLFYLLWYLLHNQRFYTQARIYLISQWERFSAFFKLKFSSAEERQPLLDPSVHGTMRSQNTDHGPLTDSGMFSRAREPNRYQQPPQGVTHTTVSLNGESGTAADGTNVTTSSGIASTMSTTSNTGSSKSCNVQLTNTN